MAVVSFDDVAATYAAERPTYKTVARTLDACLGGKLASKGVEAIVQHRAKTVQSFVKKALRKGYEDPLKQIGDKAGVRVIVHFEADVPIVESCVRSICQVVGREAKSDALAYNQLGYLGVHLDVVIDDESKLAQGGAGLKGRRAEVQIHTKAQSAWAGVSHDLLYKSPQELSEDVKRGITRLVALVEIFDGEIARFREAIESDPDYAELQVLAPLDDEIVRFTSRRPDRGLSVLVIPPLVRLYDCPADDVYPEIAQPFIKTFESELAELFTVYKNDERANPLLFQPEALLIFEHFERDVDRLKAAWPVDLVPMELLESMATIWGTEI